jgi:hypothetical protein
MSEIWIRILDFYDMIYLTATGLSPGGSSTVHIYTHKNTWTNTKIRKSAGRAPSLLLLPLRLPYN